MPQLFGTDGVRGKAGEYPLDHDDGGAPRRGAGPRRCAAGDRAAARSIVGRDTRESGEWIERELARGAGSAGRRRITSAGVIPTPAIAYVTREMGFDAGIVISASHNPFEDNGIKVFSGRGEKFTRGARARGRGDRGRRRLVGAGGGRGAPIATLDVADAYLAHARLCAAGSGAARPAPARGRLRQRRDDDRGAAALRGAGFDVQVHRRIARRAQHQSRLRLDPPGAARASGGRRAGAAMGIAFDGDGDRAIFVDADGPIVDGDAVLLMCAGR